MKTKNCPFCGKEISDEAIICKFCHRLLIDENGNDIQPETETPVEDQEQTAAPEPVSEPEEKFTEDDDKTIVYSKDDLKKALAARMMTTMKRTTKHLPLITAKATIPNAHLS